MSNRREDSVLKFSMFALVVFAVLGIVFGLILESDVIFFDGVYSIISVGMSYMSLLITRFIRKDDIKKFPFGKERIEPLVVFIQFFILNFILLLMLYDAITVIRNGGNDLNLTLTIIYLIITTILQYIFVKKMVLLAKETLSVIVKTEVALWQISLKQSIYVLVGYCFGLVFLFFEGSTISQYIDPVILILFIMVTFTQTIDDMLLAFKELIGMSTIGKESYQKVDRMVANISKEYDINQYFIRLSKVGGMIILEIDFLIDKDSKSANITHQDDIRSLLYDMIKEKEYDLWLSISFTTQMKWII